MLSVTPAGVAAVAWGATTVTLRCSALAAAPATETLLYQAARAQIVEQVIKPRLADGEIVISGEGLELLQDDRVRAAYLGI